MSKASLPESTQVVPPRRLVVEDLLQGQREVVLIHGAREYRLRITANGKLILTA